MSHLIIKFSVLVTLLVSIISCGFITSVATSDGIYNDSLKSSYQIAKDHLNTLRNKKDYKSYFKQKSNEYSKQLDKEVKILRDSTKNLIKKNKYYNNTIPNTPYDYDIRYYGYNRGYSWAYQSILPFYYNHWDFPIYAGFYPFLAWDWNYRNPWIGLNYGFWGGYNYYNNFGYHPYGYGVYNPRGYYSTTTRRYRTHRQQNTRRTNSRYSSGKFNYRTNYNVGRRANFNSTTTGSSQNTNNYNRGRQSQPQSQSRYNYNNTSKTPSYAPRRYSGSTRRGAR